MATAKQSEDITECPICTEVYTDPRVLLCGHTYCLKCIEEWIKNKQAGDKMVCPLCRKEFTVPRNGVSHLTKNFAVVGMVQVLLGDTSKASGPPCVTADRTGEPIRPKSIIVYTTFHIASP